MRVRAAAAAAGRSLNDYICVVLDAATDPELGTDEAQRVRDRLRLAGLLAVTGEPRPAPPEHAVAAARAAAGRGTPLSEIVSGQRG